MAKVGNIALGFQGEHNPIKVSIGQFYGIEINDFAVSVAKNEISERSKYIPMGFIDKEVKVTDLVNIIPTAGLYD